MTALDPLRVEEAGLNALSTRRQLFYDGWILRLSPGKARRARSVNPHFGSSLPLAEKIDRCVQVYAAHQLPLLFRITPFARPGDLVEALRARGYAPFEETLVQVAPLDGPASRRAGSPVTIASAEADAWVDAVATLRGSPSGQRDAHFERVAHLPLESRRLVAWTDGRVVAAGQVVLEDRLAGIFDVVTATGWRRRGIATALIARLLAMARERGAQAAYLQVSAGNDAAIAVYRHFGFATSYTYHYWARPAEFG